MTETENPAPRANAEGRGHSKIEQDHVRKTGRVDFAAINRAAQPLLPAILQRILPGGRREGQEYVVRNPRRCDRRRGSFKINLKTGVWCDFSSGDKGSDPVSLVAFIEDCKQGEAALKLARMLGIDARARRHG
jgi:hypothetical protein